MPRSRHSSRIVRTRRRRRSLASTARLAGLIGLGLVAVIAASALVVALTSAYFGGLVLGVGIVISAWAASVASRRQSRGPVQSLGRSRTRDCQQARWAPRSPGAGAPHPPTPAQQRARPCPGSRRI